MTKLSRLVLAATIFATSSCSLDFMRHNYGIYSKALPVLYKWNYCGPGCKDKKLRPANRVDAACYEHDKGYIRAKYYSDQHRADRKFVNDLRVLIPTLTDPEEIKYAKRAERVFSSRIIKYFGKRKLPAGPELSYSISP